MLVQIPRNVASGLFAVACATLAAPGCGGDDSGTGSPSRNVEAGSAGVAGSGSGAAATGGASGGQSSAGNAEALAGGNTAGQPSSGVAGTDGAAPGGAGGSAELPGSGGALGTGGRGNNAALAGRGGDLEAGGSVLRAGAPATGAMAGAVGGAGRPGDGGGAGAGDVGDPSKCERTIATRLRWVFAVEGRATTEPVVGPGEALLTRTYATGSGNVVCAIDPSSGALRWEATLEGFGNVVVGPTGIIYSTDWSDLLVLDADDGTATVLWSSPLGQIGGPVIGPDGTLYVSEDTATNVLYALDATGTVLWSRTLDGVYPEAVAEDGTVFVWTPDEVLAIDPESGDTLWAYPDVSFITLGQDGTVYVGDWVIDGASTVTALSPVDGSVRWQYEGSSSVVESPSGALYTEGDVVAVLDPADGSVQREFPSVAGGALAICEDGVIYELSASDQAVYGIDTADGTVLWSYPAAPAPMPQYGDSGIVCSNSVVYAALNNRLYALSTDRDIPTYACEPCAMSCGSESEVTQCLPDGTSFRSVGVCGADQQCQAGECRDCVAHDHLGCQESEVFWMDSCDRPEELVQACGAMERCRDGACEADDMHCACTCTCDYCTATITKTCVGSFDDCMTCQVPCEEACSGCGSPISYSGACYF
jgi:outer membrane protein assembly factor BamB